MVFNLGDRVRISEYSKSFGWVPEAIKERNHSFGCVGQIVQVQRGHGTSYQVNFGLWTAWFEDSELTLEDEMNKQDCCIKQPATEDQWEYIRHAVQGAYVAVEIRYPHVQEFAGRSIMVFKCDAKVFCFNRPHIINKFTEQTVTTELKPVAMFQPDASGWNDAVSYINSKDKSVIPR